MKESLKAWWLTCGHALVKDRFSSQSKYTGDIWPEEVECHDAVFEDDLIDTEDLECDEVMLSSQWEACWVQRLILASV